jgi:hypothetical protein
VVCSGLVRTGALRGHFCAIGTVRGATCGSPVVTRVTVVGALEVGGTCQQRGLLSR